MDLRPNVKQENTYDYINDHQDAFGAIDNEFRPKNVRVNRVRAHERKTKIIFASSLCCTTMRLWWRSNFARFEEFIHTHQWKVLSIVLLLVLFCLGLKMVSVDTDFDKLWVEESDRLISEWTYLAQALKRVSAQAAYADQHYFAPDTRRSRVNSLLGGRAPIGRPPLDPTDPLSSAYGPASSAGANGQSKTGPFANSLPGREFMGTMETILQTSTRTINGGGVGDSSDGVPSPDRLARDDRSSTTSSRDAQILTPRALLDHMEFLVKVRRLQITVGPAKWSFKDLCQRATLPFGSEVHPIQAYLDMIIPCVIITPLDCFWEGAKVLGPEEATWIPWFDDRTLLQWTTLDPIGLLRDLQKHSGNHSRQALDMLIGQFLAAGINHGYLNRTCLDPKDPACPVSAPNYRGQPPDVAQVLTGGCPGFAANVLHWSEEIIVGGRVHENASSHLPPTTDAAAASPTTGAHPTPVLVRASALQSLILLRSPRDLYEAVRHSDPYKHEGWTLADAQHVLDEWRRNLRRLVMEHNVGLAPDDDWHFYAFTDNSLRDLLRELTLRLGPVKVVGCVLLVLLYGLVCLLGWRDPVRSQCWLALAGLLVAALSAVAGLGICAVIGLPFNVLTIQVLPFLVMGLGVDGLFTLTTCHDCCVVRRATASPWNSNASKSLTQWASNSSIATCSSTSTGTSSTYCSASTSYTAPVLAQHGPSLLFGTIAIAGSFFSAAFIPIPLMRQFCLQAGILVLVQSITMFLLFPVLLRFDGIRRSQRRLDVLCCLRHPAVFDTTNSSLEPITQPMYSTHPKPTKFKRPQDRRSSQFNTRSIRPLTTTDTGGTATQKTPLRNPSVGSTRTCAHSTNSTSTTSSSIQLNVFNQLSDQVTDITCSSVPHNTVMHQGADEQQCVISHTVHATVTVKSLCDNPIATTKTEPERSDETKKGRAARFHPAVTTDMALSQTSIHNCPARASPSSRRTTLVSRIGTVDRSVRSTSPLLVQFARRLALGLTHHWSIQAVVCLLGCSLFIVAGCLLRYCLHLGLDWASLTPMDTVEYGFVKESEKAFGLYNFQVIARGTDLPGSRPAPALHQLLWIGSSGVAGGDSSLTDGGDSLATSRGLPRARTSVATVGRGIDFPMQQRRLLHLYTRLTQLPGVMLAGRRVWLEAMRDWLQQVQNAFDADRESGWITDQGRWTANASELGVLGLRLIVQTDRGPELGRIKTGRLVHGGIVDPPAFYVLLRVWRTYDALNFSSLACVIHPEPMPFTLGRVAIPPGSPGLLGDLYALPPADPIEFVQTNFYAHGVRGMGVQLDLVQSVRHLTESATVQGVPSFPIGVPFTFAEHYIYLLRETGIAFGIFTSIILVAGLILFSSPVIVLLLLVVGAGGGVCAAICGLFLLGLELNPISTGLLLFSGGLGARLAAGFLGAWPDLHSWTRVNRASADSAKLCLCRRPDCSAILSTQYCTVLSTSNSNLVSGSATPGTTQVWQPVVKEPLVEHMDTEQPLSTPSVTSTPGAAGRFGLHRGRRELRRGRARSELARLMCNQFAPALHTTVGLILSLALLAAARVQFIANYFFYLIAFVSLICLFNTVCLIPTLHYYYFYYWLRPFKEMPSSYNDYYFLNRTAPMTSTSTRPCLRHCTRQPHDEVSSTPTVYHHPTHTAEPQTSQTPVVLPSSVSASSLSSSNESGSSSSSSSTASSSNSCNSTKSTHSRECTGDDEQRLAAPPTDGPNLVSLSKCRTSLAQSTSELYELCGVRLRDVTQSLHRNLNWLDTATAAAAVVAAAAAAAVASASTSPPHRPTQPPSRPASLSTISEEPSHSSSTVSLNRISPSVNNSTTTGTSSNSKETSGSGPLSGAELEKTAWPPPPSQVLLDASRLLSMESSSIRTNENGLFHRRLYEPSHPLRFHSTLSGRSAVPSLNPLPSTALPSNLPRHQTETSPPPSYSSIVNTHPAGPRNINLEPADSIDCATYPHLPTLIPPARSECEQTCHVVNLPGRRKSSRSRSSHAVSPPPTTPRTNPRVRLELHHHHHHHHYGSRAEHHRDQSGDPVQGAGINSSSQLVQDTLPPPGTDPRI